MSRPGALAMMLLLASPATAGQDPPPQDSTAALAARVAEAVDSVRTKGPALGLGADRIANLTACEDLEGALVDCHGEALARCARVLGALDRPLLDATSRGDRFTRASARTVATEVVDAVLRLASARAASQGGPCPALAPAGAVPAAVLVGPNRHTLSVRPLVALRPARRWALVVEGISASERAALRARAVPGAADGIAPGALVTPRLASFGQDSDFIDTARLASLLQSLEADAARSPGSGVLAGVQLHWPTPFRLAEPEERRFFFVPIQGAVPPEAVVTFRTVDGRAGLLAYRDRLNGIGCSRERTAPLDVAQTLGRPRAAAGVVAGSYRSLEIRGRTAEAPLLGLPAAEATTVERPFLLALPDNVDDATALVLGVDGHTGSARRFLRAHAPGLTSRGMALLSMDLPEHGERAAAGRTFVDPLDPSGLVANMRQSVTDVLAVLAFVRRCGVTLPDGSVYRPREVRYLGYSLGAMLGVAVRSVTPELGTTVLLAGAGDIPGWLMLQVAPPLRGRYVSCLGGPEHGESCFPSGVCAAPGVCDTDPLVEELTESIALPFALATAGADPLEFARIRTGEASPAPLLLITGGVDVVLHAMLATRLADAYDMRPRGPGLRRGPRSTRVQWPELGHELGSVPEVREQAYEFLASRGRRLFRPPASAGAVPE